MKIHELLNGASQWTQGTCARDANGDSCSVVGKAAVCWCLLGAICKCYSGQQQMAIIRKVTSEVGVPVGTYNDQHTYEEVLALAKELDI